MKDRLIATARTVMAGAVSWVLTWAAGHWGVVLSESDTAVVQGAVFVLVLGVYHSAASALQRRWPVWAVRFPVLGWVRWVVALLLLTDAQPTYTRPETLYIRDNVARL